MGSEHNNFKEEVNNEPFTLEIIASKERMEIILNKDKSVVHESVDIERWGVFENYFKAGNYLQTRDKGVFSEVKYYELEVTQ